MHELSIATGLVESVEEHARRVGAAKVVAINLLVGERSGVVDESLRFCFDLVAPGTRAAGARLNLRRAAARFHCATCAADYAPSFERADFGCPRCRATGVLVDDGTAVMIESLEIERPDPAGWEADG